MLTTFAHRLNHFIERQLFITIKEFEKKCGFSTGVIHRAIKNGTNIGIDKLEIIHEFYPELNMDWLISGEGEMLDGPQNVKNDPLVIIQKLSDSIRTMTESELLRANNESKLITILERTSQQIAVK